MPSKHIRVACASRLAITAGADDGDLSLMRIPSEAVGAVIGKGWLGLLDGLVVGGWTPIMLTYFTLLTYFTYFPDAKRRETVFAPKYIR